jgi:hypothetical protein
MVMPLIPLPARGAHIVGVALPFIELGAGIALLFAPSLRLGGALAAVLGLAFFTTAISALKTTHSFPCGCAGGNDPVSLMTLVRASLIVASGVVLARLGGGPLPLPVAVAVIVVSAAPSMVAVSEQVRSKRVRRRMARPQTVDELIALLATPSGGPARSTIGTGQG